MLEISIFTKRTWSPIFLLHVLFSQQLVYFMTWFENRSLELRVSSSHWWRQTYQPNLENSARLHESRQSSSRRICQLTQFTHFCFCFVFVFPKFERWSLGEERERLVTVIIPFGSEFFTKKNFLTHKITYKYILLHTLPIYFITYYYPLSQFFPTKMNPNSPWISNMLNDRSN